MVSKIVFLFCSINVATIYGNINISGLLSNDLNKKITRTQKKKAPIALSGRLSSAELSAKAVVQKKDTKRVNLSGLLNHNQLNSVIQFIENKQQQSKNISGLISKKALNSSIVWNRKKKKPRRNLSSFLVQNYLDPDYQAAFKILNNPYLKQEYTDSLESIETYFKQYYLNQSTTKATQSIDLGLLKICCPSSNNEYSLCQKEQ